MKVLKSLTIACFCLMIGNATAQKVYTKAEIFADQKAVWFGIDYSLAKIKGEYEQPGHPLYKTPAQIVEDFFEAWNTVVASEPNKYNIAKTFEKKKVENDIMIAERRNSKVDPMELLTRKEYILEKDKVIEAVKDYKSFTTKEGVGIVFFAECLNNDEKMGTYYVVLFDIASREVMVCEKVTGKPAGAGLKNYWAGSVADALSEAKKAYKTWK
jgi:hypothetical protein